MLDLFLGRLNTSAASVYFSWLNKEMVILEHTHVSEDRPLSFEREAMLLEAMLFAFFLALKRFQKCSST